MSDVSEHLRELLAEELDDVANTVGRRLEGLSDQEYFWEPVPDYCWTVRPRATARTTLANGRGDWVVDYDLPDPTPPPFTTIAWQIMHCHLINEVDHDRFFGGRTMKRLWDDVDVAHTAASALDAWARSLQRFRIFLDEVAAPDLAGVIDDPVRQVVRPAWWFVRLVVNENRHHGAVAGALRDLYLHSNAGNTWRIPARS